MASTDLTNENVTASSDRELEKMFFLKRQLSREDHESSSTFCPPLDNSELCHCVVLPTWLF